MRWNKQHKRESENGHMKTESIPKRLFPIVSFTGLAIVSIELIMQLFDTSVCHTEGCKVVAQYARYGDIAMLIPGIMIFAALALLSEFNLVLCEKRLDSFINIILTAAIAAEGFLVGYQAFRLHISCMFCLTVFVIFVLLGILRVLDGHKEIVSGFTVFVVILCLFHLVLPAANNNCDCIINSRLTLFYNDDCPHCKVIEDICEQCDIQVNKLPAREHLALLSSMNIKEVPVLLVNDGKEKRILIGADRIEKYLDIQRQRQVKAADWITNFLSTPAHAKACKIGEPCKR